MKRILSIILCVAMLASMASMTVLGVEYGTQSDKVTTENVMTFTTDKETYAAGDTVTITVAMDSIWGDPTLEDYIEGYEDYVMPGAYGMNILCSTLIYDKTVFTAKAHTNLISTSTIKNADVTTVSGNNPIEAKTNGAYYLMAVTESFASSYEEYGFMTGSGDLWQYNLTIAADAAPGTYYLPVGPYVITDEETGAAQGKIPAIKFADDSEGRLWAWLGNVDSYFVDQPVTYKTNYTGGSRVAADSPMGAQYECSYVAITIKGEENPEDIAAAAEVDALIDAIGAPVMEDVLLLDAINHDGIYTHIGNVEGSNFTVSFDMIPNGAGDTYGFLGGVTDTDSGTPRIFWNGAEKKFQIAKTDSWMNSSAVEEVLAESEVMDLPLGSWTSVEFVYAGNDLSVKVNGETVVSYTYEGMNYAFYIFYPSKVSAYLQNCVVTGDFGTDNMHDYFTHDAYITGDVVKVEEISAAQTAYEALNANAKSFVTKKAELDAAVAALDAYIAAQNQAAADKAIALIDAIGEVSYPASGDAIVAAEEYVATLTETQLALVTNYDTLTAARAEYERREGLYNQAKADYVISLIDAIGEVTFDSRDAIELAEKEYDLLIDVQKDLVTNYGVLVAAREAYNLYAPVMNAENMINALGIKLYQGNVTHFDAVNLDNAGYYNFPDQDTDNNWWGMNFTFDFMYLDANKTEKGSSIGIFRNGDAFAGYDFKTKSFVIGAGGGWYNGSNGPCDFVVQKEYNLVPGTWYNMTIDFEEGTGVASVYLNGELMVQATPADSSYDFTIFYPQQVDMYIGDNTLTFGATYPYPFSEHPLTDAAAYDFPGAGGSRDYYKLNTSIDVMSPVDVAAKIQAAEEAVAALTEDQAALLDASYTDALAAFKADYEAKVAEIQAAAAEVVALIDAITDAESINAAQAAYAALTVSGKALVTNYAELEAANANLVADQIAAIGEITPDSNAAISAAESAYNALTEAEKVLVTNLDVLVAARNDYNAMMAAIANVETMIDGLAPGGSAIKNTADGGSVGSYSQWLDNAENLVSDSNPAPYATQFDVYVESVTDTANAYIGGSSENDVFVGYDFVRGTVFVANAGPWGYSSDIAAEDIVAEAEYALETGAWYTFKFVMGDATVEIYVNGELVLETAVTEPTGWFIYYPKNNVSYYDNVMFWYDGELQTSMIAFDSVNAGNWTAMSGGYSVVSDAPIGDVAENALVSTLAAYNALADVAKPAVSNYDVLKTALEAYNKNLYYTGAVVAPEGVNAVAAEGGINVSWNAVENGVKYWVYVDGQVVTATTETDIFVPASAGEHTVKVAVAINVNEALGGYATYVSGTSEEIVAEALEIPAVELVVDATATENSITASWNAIDGAVYYVTFNVGGTDIVVKTTNTTITLAKYVTADTEYTVSVQALVAKDGGYDITESNVFAGVTAEPEFHVIFDGESITWTEVEGATIYWLTIVHPTNGKTYTVRYNAVAEYAFEFVTEGAYDVTVTAYAAGQYSVATTIIEK